MNDHTLDIRAEADESNNNNYSNKKGAQKQQHKKIDKAASIMFSSQSSSTSTSGTPSSRAVARAASSSSSSGNNGGIRHQPQNDDDNDDDDDDDNNNKDERDGLMMRRVATLSTPRTYRGLRRWRLLQLVLALAAMLVTYQLTWQYYLSGYNIPDQDVDPVTGRRRFRRHPDRLHKYDPTQGKHVPTEPFDGVMEGLLTLTSIGIPKHGLVHHASSSGSSSYADVSATFCHISWDLQQSEPNKVAMFSDLKQQSPLCAGTVYSVDDLYTLARKARAYDAAAMPTNGNTNTSSSTTFASTPKHKGHQVVPIPTAIIFHESRCGSTLVSNVFAASKPGHTRTYSEAQAPLQALLACEKVYDDKSDHKHHGRHCDDGAHEQLIRDVFYMLGRLRRPVQPQYIFYKIQSAGTRAMNVFHRAMPHVPWMFVYRNSIEVVMSHLKDQDLSTTTTTSDQQPGQGTGGAMCLRTFHDAWQPPALVNLVESKLPPGRSMESLSKEEYCAAHLATLGQAAIAEYRRQQQQQHEQHLQQSQQSQNSNQRPQQQQHGWFINYKDLPFVLWEHVIPELRFMGTPSAADIAQWQGKVTSLYTKGRAGSSSAEQQQQRHWQEDSLVKQSRAPESVKRAVALFLDPIYQEMEQIRLAQQPQQH